MNIRALGIEQYKDGHMRRIAARLLDSRVGILSGISQIARFPNDPEFFHFSCKAADTFPLSGQKNFSYTGGASSVKEQAIAKAIGEAIERYCSAFYDVNELPLCSYSEADFPCVHPEDFALYSDEQYEQEDFLFVPFTCNTPVRWTQMMDPFHDTEVYLPAAAVYLPYFYYQGTDDSPILQPISTGLACHASFEKAAMAAICEVVERDAVMICWQARLSMPHIRIETLSDANYERARKLEMNGSRVTILDLTMDHGIPTILSVLSGNNPESPAVIFAGAADPDPERAVCKSLEELPHTRRYCARMMSYAPPFETEFPHHPNVTRQQDHLHFYCDATNARNADFIFQSSARKSFEDLASLVGKTERDSLNQLLEAIASTGETVYLKGLTTEDMRDLSLFVVRAVIPGFQRLCMGYRNRTLGGKRLWEVPSRLGYPGIEPKTGDNPAPHPYP